MGGLLDPTNRSDLQTPEKASQAMESMLLQRMLASCNLMGKSSAPGAGMRSDLFVEALADAVSKSGGMGLASEITAQTGAAKAGEGQENDEGEKKLSTANSSGSGADLETQLLSTRRTLIGNGKRAEDSLGEP